MKIRLGRVLGSLRPHCVVSATDLGGREWANCDASRIIWHLLS